MPPEFLTTSEVMSLLHWSESSVQRARASGRLPFLKLGSNGVRFRKEHVLALMEPATIQPAQKSWQHTRHDMSEDAAELPSFVRRSTGRAAA
jgi:excisionase family DNA binding protein